MKIMINSPVNSILPFSMNYYYVILLRQKSCGRNNDDVCLSFHCCAYLSRHFPRLVGFSCILHHFKLIKTMITMITIKTLSFIKVQGSDSVSFKNICMYLPMYKCTDFLIPIHSQCNVKAEKVLKQNKKNR